MKKIFSKIIVGAFLLGCLSPIFMNGNIRASAESEPVTIDMYLLGGQSNAVGCSEIGNERTESFNNIWYAGEIERKVTIKQLETDDEQLENENESAEPEYEYKAAQSWIETFADFKKFVSGGMGYHATSIGPEYGMAKVFNQEYEGDKKRAIIFKTAYGGSYLHSTATGANWASPSNWRKGYKPDPDKPTTESNRQGLFYQRFIDNFEHVYNELKANGYNPVIKGMAWMQGEADAGEASARMCYYINLKTFINDIRADVVRITGDESLQEMPFIIGKIAKTFMQYDNQYTTAINEIQQAVADSEDMKNVYAVDTDDLIIVDKNGKIKGSGGWDNCHYNFKDMVKLGERFAQTFQEADKNKGCASNISVYPVAIVFGVFAGVVLLTKTGKKEN